jgi:ribosomal protein S18 acetylase RimI-like enzyme
MQQLAFIVRAGEDADWPALGKAVADLQDLERDLVGFPLAPGSAVWQDYLADLRERLCGGDGMFLVAEAGEGNVVGVLVGYVHQAGDRLVDAAFDRSAYICDLFVQSGWRGRGVGRALVRAFEAAMRAKGLQWMSICVKSRNTTARAAYQALGFEEYETILTKRLA